jgi:hypothetical protein
MAVLEELEALTIIALSGSESGKFGFLKRHPRRWAA